MITQSAELEEKTAGAHEARGDDHVEGENDTGALEDWRGLVRASPLLVVGLAFAGGLALASVSRSRKRARGSRREREPEQAGEFTAADADADAPVGDVAEEGRLHEVWERLRGALIEVAADEVASYLDELVPGAEPTLARRPRHKTPKI